MVARRVSVKGTVEGYRCGGQNCSSEAAYSDAMSPDELQALNDAVKQGTARLWHGGAPALRVGDLILPPAVTGVQSMRSSLVQGGLGRVTTREDHVYVTTERSLARAVAAYWNKRAPGNGRGWVYRVELDAHDVALDEDLPRGPFISFQLPSVRIAAIADAGVDPNNPRHFRELQRFVDAIG